MIKVDKAHIKKLKQAYLKRQLVPFVGAGLSIPFEMPGWGTLINNIYNDYEYSISEENKNEITKLIENFQYLEAVDKMKQAGLREEYIRDSICSAIQEKKLSNKEEPDNIYKDLAKMNCTKYLTTNYDNYLSDYVGKGPSEITHLYKEFINELDFPIYHSMVYNLHGDYTKPSSIIFSKDSYNDLYYNNVEFRKVLEHFRERYTLLFIGISLDDEYIQQVLEVSKNKLNARHYILLSNVSKERRIQLEEQYNVTILEYLSHNNGHTENIRKILEEIMNISDEFENQGSYQFLKNDNTIQAYNPQIKRGSGPDSLPILKEAISLPLKDSVIYENIKEITKLQHEGKIKEAINEYNKILQGSIFEPLSENEKKLVIKGLLYCYIINRDYKNAESLIETAMKLPKSKDDIDLLSYLIDYFFNISDYESANIISYEWYKLDEDDPLLIAINYYTRSVYQETPYDCIFNQLLNKDLELCINTTDNNHKQYIYRLAGEIAIYKEHYDDAVHLLRKAYEIDDNLFNIEDLGVAVYLKALGNADDGTIIKIENIDFGWLEKAVEYFELCFARTTISNRQGVYLRVANLYLRSLFYLRKTIEFDQMYKELIDYCDDDLLEIQKMRAINNIWINKFNESDVEGLGEIDKALIMNEFYNTRGMYKHGIDVLKKIINEDSSVDENMYIQFLCTLLNLKDAEQFNEYYAIYSERWPKSDRMKLIRSYYFEVNSLYGDAEKEIRSIIDLDSSVINYNILISFFRRTQQINRVGEVYEEILRDRQELIDSDPGGFYINYHDYLMQTNNVRKALWLYTNKVKDNILSDVQKFIEIDLKIRLNDFNDVAENSLNLYEKYKSYGEMIYAYYASVAYLHHNDFEKSRHCLNMYKTNGRVDELSNSLVKKVEDKLNVLQNKIFTDWSGRINFIKDIAVNIIKTNPRISIPKGEPLVIDIIALYVLSSMGKLNRLEHNPKIFVAFTTIEKLHDTYCYCGDELILKIIDYIKAAENISLLSPSMESALNNRENLPNTYQDYFDSLTIACEGGYSFVKGYDLPLGFHEGKPIMVGSGINTIKIVNQEILVYSGES